MRLLYAVPLAVSVLASARAAAAQPACDEALLSHEAERARVWRYTWSGINAGLMLGSFVAIPIVDRESRPDWVVSGVGSGVTLLATWFFPLRVEEAEAELAALPPAAREKRRLVLLRESAEDERERVTWPWHALNFGVAAASGAVIAFGFDHYLSGALTFAGAAILGEAQLFTQPTALVENCGVACGALPDVAFLLPQGRGPRAWRLTLSGKF